MSIKMMSTAGTTSIVLLTVLLTFLIQGLNGQSIGFLQRANVNEDIGSADVCVFASDFTSGTAMDTTLNISIDEGRTQAGPGDFVPQTATIFLTAAEVEAGTLKCFTINITDDQIVEDPESIVYQIVNTDPPGITISNEEEFTINDNDMPTISLAREEQFVSEEDGGMTMVCFLFVGPSGGLEKEFPISAQIVPGTATTPEDYIGTTLSAVFQPGTLPGNESCGTIQVDSNAGLDGNRQFQVVLVAAPTIEADLVEPLTTNITIVDDENATLTLELPVSVTEGESFDICVRIDEFPQVAIDVSVGISSQNGVIGQSSDDDFNIFLLELTFAINARLVCGSVEATSDLLIEGVENFTASLLTVSLDLVLGPSVTSTINDADRANVSFAVSELSASEGDPDVSVCVELIDLPVNGSAIPITVSISNIINIGAMRCNLMNYARNPADFFPSQLTLTFPAGVSPIPQCLNVTIIDDSIAENNETIKLTLSSTDLSNVEPNGITQTEVTIIDNDVITLTLFPTMAVSIPENVTDVDLFVNISSSGLVANLERTINVTVDPSGGTATPDVDFISTDIFVIFECDEDIMLPEIKEFSVGIIDDFILEGTEVFSVGLLSASPSDNVELSSETVSVSIEDDEFVAGFNQTEFFLLEDSFFVYLEFAISEGTIRRPTEFVITSTDGESDFQVIPSTVTLSPDTTSATLSILVTNDAVTEPDETFQFTINATSDQSAILVNNTVTLTIDSDDASEVFLNVSSTATEGTILSACVGVRGRSVGSNLTVELSAISMTAISGMDFAVNDLSLTFLITAFSTETCQDILNIIADNFFEDFEVFDVNITSTSIEDVTIGMPASQNVTITNVNEVTLTITIETLSINENGGMTNILATMSPDILALTLTFQFNFTSSSATLDSDFEISNDTIQFKPFPDLRPATIEVNATDDEILEGEENIVFSLVSSDVLDLPGMNIVIVNDTISIVDDEVIRIEFIDSVFNFTEGDINGEVCIRPESIPAAGYSVPIIVDVFIVSSSIDSSVCSGSGMASAADFNISSELTFTFPANSTDQQCLSLNITSDGLTEDTETFNLGISVISPPLIATSGQPATVTINNTDTITVGIVRVMAGGVPEDVGNVLTCVIVDNGQLCSSTVATVTVTPPLNLNSATAGVDFIDGPFTADLPVGSTINTTACFNITIIDDMVVDQTAIDSEVIDLKLDDASNPLITAAMFTNLESIAINDNDAAVRFANDSFIVYEGQNVSICVEIFSGQLLDQASILLEMVANPSAGAVNAIGSDFILLTSLLTFDSETTINCSALTISEDIIKEANESLYFRITEDEPTIVSSNDTLNITIISKNVAVVSFAFVESSITVPESVGDVVLCTELSGADIAIPLTISYEIIDGSATAPADFTPPMTLLLSFWVGSIIGTQQCITIAINDDNLFENTQNFTVRLLDPESAFCTIGNQSEVTVLIEDNDDITLSFNIDELTINEGVSDDRIQLILDLPGSGLEQDFTGSIVPILDTAESGDFTFDDLSFTFANTVTPPQAFINFTLNATADLLLEQDQETFNLTFDTLGTNVTIGAIPNITITIINLDAGTLAFPAAVKVLENDVIGVVGLQLSLAMVTLEDPLVIILSYTDGTAQEIFDYVPINETLTFMPNGSLALEASFRLVQDELFEMDLENFTVSVVNSSFSTVSIPMPVTVRIEDTDFANFSVSPVMTSVVENEGNATICIILDGPASGIAVDLEVPFNLTNVTAFAGEDFTVPATTFALFPAFSSVNKNVCIDIGIIEDLVFEQEELFTFEIFRPDPISRTVVDPSVSNITIIDNELRVDFLNDSLAIITSETAATFPVCFEVVEGTPTFDHDISLSPDPLSTAIEGSDYVLLGNPLIINATSLSGCIYIQIVDDDFFENDDFVSFTVMSTSPGLQVAGSLNLTIINIEFPEFDFNNTKYIVNENNNTEVCVKALSSGASISPELPVNVTLTARNKTATEGADFTFPSGLELTFSHSSSVECVPVMIIKDGEEELTEYFLVSFDSFGVSDEVEVVIYDANVCPNVEGGSICEDSIFLRVCNSIRARNGGVVPRSCQVVRDEYTDIDHQPSADNP